MKKFKVIAGIFILLLILAINLIVAANYYFLDTIKIGEFYFWQAKENDLFTTKELAP